MRWDLGPRGRVGNRQQGRDLRGTVGRRLWRVRHGAVKKPLEWRPTTAIRHGHESKAKEHRAGAPRPAVMRHRTTLGFEAETLYFRPGTSPEPQREKST